jgi:hypothetical protein
MASEATPRLELSQIIEGLDHRRELKANKRTQRLKPSMTVAFMARVNPCPSFLKMLLHVERKATQALAEVLAASFAVFRK